VEVTVICRPITWPESRRWRKKPLSATPIENVVLPSGRHTLVLVNPELGVRKKIQVTIRAGKTKRYVENLRALQSPPAAID